MLLSTFRSKLFLGAFVLAILAVGLTTAKKKAPKPKAEEGDRDNIGGQVPIKNVTIEGLTNFKIGALNFSRVEEVEYGGDDDEGTAVVAEDSGEGDDTCKLPKEKGTCSNAEPRYYYSRRSKVCKRFRYSGCGGNGNNFHSRGLCERKCTKGHTRTRSHGRGRERGRVDYDYADYGNAGRQGYGDSYDDTYYDNRRGRPGRYRSYYE